MIPLLTCQREEPEKHRGRDGIPGGNGAVRAGFHSLDQPLVIVTGKETASAACLVPEMGFYRIRHEPGLVQIPAVRSRFERIEQCGR